MTWNNLLLEKDGPVAVLTINRPKVLNALNGETVRELGEAIEQLERDSEVAVVIITGAGDRAFVAGADIAFMQNLTPMEAREFAQLGQRVLSRIENLSKPVIAAVNGFALGGGCELAMACDLRLAADTAVFGQPEIKLGIIPGAGGTQRLARLVGLTRAKELVFFGEPIDAQEAYRIGLVNRVVPADRLLAEARAWAERLAALPPVALALAKRALDAGASAPLPVGLDLERLAFAALFGTADEQEGVAAFLERRPPRFTGG